MEKIITYDQMKAFYEDFKKNPPTDAFTKYFKEIGFMNSLIKFAEKMGLKEDVFEYTKIRDEAVAQINKMAKGKK